MKRYLIKMTAAFLSGALLTGCSVIPAYANSGEDPNPEEVITSFEELELIRPVDDDDEEEDPPVAEARIVDDINAEEDEYEDNSLTALTPEGNMTLVDDITTKGGKQFLTMTSRSGSYFYIVIDRAKSGENNVYFLNQVDERDLLSSMNEGSEEESRRGGCPASSRKGETGRGSRGCSCSRISGCTGRVGSHRFQGDPDTCRHQDR